METDAATTANLAMGAATGDTVESGDASSYLVCYSPTMITTNGIWSGDNPLEYSLPLFILQTTLIVAFTRIVYIFLKPLRQPRYLAEVIGGVMLGPSVMGKIPNYMDVIFPTRSIAIVETMANLGLVYFIFLVGLQIDPASMQRMGRRTWAMAAASIALPIGFAVAAFFAFGTQIQSKTYADGYMVFLSVSLSITAFSELARTLAELKLLNTETGRMAMSTSFLTNGLAWVLLAIAIALTGKHRSPLASLGVISSGFAFILGVYYTVRPAAAWIVSKTREGEPVDALYLCLIMLAVMASGVMADAVGIHAVFGAFVFGVAIPEGPLVSALIEKLEDFVTGLLLPLYFTANGIQVRFESMSDLGISGFLALVIGIAAFIKVGTTSLVSSLFYGVSAREGALLGVLLNTKGIMEMMILRIALDKNVLYQQSYSMMVVMSVLITFSVTPIAGMLASPGRHLVNYKRRMIQRLKADAELRVLACIHTARNVPSVVNLIDISHPTKNSPIFVCAVHLLELTGRESAMLVVHDAHRSSGVGFGARRKKGQKGNLNRAQAQSQQIMTALETYEQHAAGVSVFPVTVISAFSTMHDDIIRLAEDKHAALLILPFHKQQTVDGGMEVANPGIRTVNQAVLADAPCSVAILVDRGLGGAARVSATMGRQSTHQIAIIFVGGMDDREALTYACRMAEHPGVHLTVLRFIDALQAASVQQQPRLSAAGHQPRLSAAGHQPRLSAASAQGVLGQSGDARVLNILTDADRERLLDEECIKDFRVRFAGDETVNYLEKVVNNGEEIVSSIRSMDNSHDLYVVGRSDGVDSPLITALSDFSECPELGPIGDLLASSDFAATVSVLVVQQYRGAPQIPLAEGPLSPETPKNTHFKDRVTP